MSETKEQLLINNLEQELLTTASFIAGECIKVAETHKGIVDAKNKDFLNLKSSLLDSPAIDGKDVKSLKVAEQAINEKIEKSIKAGKGNEELFAPLRKKLTDLRSELEKNLSSNEGISKLIDNKLKRNLIGTMALLKDDKFMDITEKNKAVNQIMSQNISLPDAVRKKILSNPAYKKDVETKTINKINKFFSSGPNANVKGVYNFDPTKLTPKNIEAFHNELNHSFNVMSNPITASISKTKNFLSYISNMRENLTSSKTFIPNSSTITNVPNISKSNTKKTGISF